MERMSEHAADEPPDETTRVRHAAFAVLAMAGAALAVVAYRIQVDDLYQPGARALASVAVGLAFLAAGLVAWSRRPDNRLGPLMTLTAFALLARQLSYSHDPALFTAFFAL